VLAENPDVAEMRNSRLGAPPQRRLVCSEVLVVEQHQAVDFGHLKPGIDEVDPEHRQLLELDAQRVGIPGAGLAEAVERDAERAKLGIVEVVDDDAGNLRDASRLRRLPEAVNFDDRPLSVDQDPEADPEPVDACLQLRALPGLAAPHLPRGQAVGITRLVVKPRRKIVAARARRMRFDFVERALVLSTLASPLDDLVFHATRVLDQLGITKSVGHNTHLHSRTTVLPGDEAGPERRACRLA
jgi:hypothetical protein